MTKPQNRPVRRALINNLPYFIQTQPIRSIDRIQLSIRNSGSNYVLVLMVFRDSMTFIRETRKKHKGGYKIIWTFKWEDLSVYVIYCGGYWFSIQIMDPDEDIQILLRDLISKVVPLSNVSLSQVEFALDFYADDESKADEVFDTLANHAVLKGIRARYARRVKTSHYQGPPNKLHSGPRKLIIYPKFEHGHWFTRIELEVHKEMLKRHRIDFNSLPLSPDDIDVLDYVTFREKIDIRTVAERYALSRVAKYRTKDPKRKRACFITRRGVTRGILTSALESNPRYGIDDLTAAEQICLLKEKLSTHSQFKICLERHFPAFPSGRCGNVCWKAY